jgi:hypothetical protein
MTQRPSEGYGAALESAVWERIQAAINFEESDRVPIWDYLDNRAVVDHFACEGDDYHTAMVRVYHNLGIDLCRGYGSAFTDEQEDEESSSEMVMHKISGRTSWKVRYEIESIEALKAYEPEPVSVEWIREHWVSNIRSQQGRFAPHTFYVPGHGCGFHAAYGLMGQELFCYAIYDARREIDRIMEVLSETAVRIATVAAEEKLAPLFFIGDDIAYKGTLMFSPQFLRETFIPMLKRMIVPLKDAGITVIYHSDGYLMEIMDDLLAAGVDGLNPIEPLAGMDLGVLKQRYGKYLILVGGIDCSQLLPLGTPGQIQKVVTEAMRIAAPGGGFFIGSSSEIVPATPLENILRRLPRVWEISNSSGAE